MYLLSAFFSLLLLTSFTWLGSLYSCCSFPVLCLISTPLLLAIYEMDFHYLLVYLSHFPSSSLSLPTFHSLAGSRRVLSFSSFSLFRVDTSISGSTSERSLKIKCYPVARACLSLGLSFFTLFSLFTDSLCQCNTLYATYSFPSNILIWLVFMKREPK